MASIKPGLFNIFLQRFDKHMFKTYLNKVKSSNYEQVNSRNAGIKQVGVSVVTSGNPADSILEVNQD